MKYTFGIQYLATAKMSVEADSYNEAIDKCDEAVKHLPIPDDPMLSDGDWEMIPVDKESDQQNEELESEFATFDFAQALHRYEADVDTTFYEGEYYEYVGYDSESNNHCVISELGDEWLFSADTFFDYFTLCVADEVIGDEDESEVPVQ